MEPSLNDLIMLVTDEVLRNRMLEKLSDLNVRYEKRCRQHQRELAHINDLRTM